MTQTSVVESIEARIEALKQDEELLITARTILISPVPLGEEVPDPDGTRTRARRREREDQLVATLEASPVPMSVGDLGRAMGVHPSNLYRVTRKLVGFGRITDDGYGWFSAARDGQDSIA